MRNLSTLVIGKCFVTFNVNCEYYSEEPEMVLSKVIHALALAFETPLIAVKAACEFVARGEEYHPELAPSEYRVIQDLFQFFQLATERYSDEGYWKVGSGSIQFTYVNMNTGASVGWSSVVG